MRLRGDETVLRWYPVYGHPGGPQREPWYVVSDDLVFRTGHHPDGRGLRPCFRVVADEVYPTEHHQSGASEEPWFHVLGSLVYPAAGHPDGGGAPWYQVRVVSGTRTAVTGPGRAEDRVIPGPPVLP